MLLWLLALVGLFGVLLIENINYQKPEQSSIMLAETAETFSGGTGSVDDPYKISTYADLQAISAQGYKELGVDYEKFEGKYFELTNDIVIDGATWCPIGGVNTLNYSSSGNIINGFDKTSGTFCGNFNGNNYTLTVNNSIAMFATLNSFNAPLYSYGGYFGGIFGQCCGSTIENLNVCYNSSDTIFNISVGGAAHGSFIGGIAASVVDGKITNCTVSSTKESGLTVAYNMNASGNSQTHATFGGVTAVAYNSEISNCQLLANFDGSWGNSPSFVYSFGGVVGYSFGTDSIVSNCKVKVDKFNCSSKYTDIGVIAGRATKIVDCVVEADCQISVSSSQAITYAGVISGYAETIERCKVNGKTSVSASSSMSNQYAGGIAGQCGTINNCDISGELTVSSSNMDGAAYAGGIVAKCETLTNCRVSGTLKITLSADSGGGIGIFAGTVATINNCFANVNIGENMSKKYNYGAIAGECTGNAYNCVVIGTASYGLINCGTNGTATTDTTNGLYSVLADDSLKLKETYVSGTATYQWNAAAPWDFETMWIATDNYPILRLTYVPDTIDIAINFSTNADRSYLIYLLDESGAVAREFVVCGTGQCSVVGWSRNAKFTIFISHTLYMNCKIQNKDAQKMTFDAAENATIEVSISAPTGVNNWVAI